MLKCQQAGSLSHRSMYNRSLLRGSHSAGILMRRRIEGGAGDFISPRSVFVFTITGFESHQWMWMQLLLLQKSNNNTKRRSLTAEVLPCSPIFLFWTPRYVCVRACVHVTSHGTHSHITALSNNTYSSSLSVLSRLLLSKTRDSHRLIYVCFIIIK